MTNPEQLESFSTSHNNDIRNRFLAGIASASLLLGASRVSEVSAYDTQKAGDWPPVQNSLQDTDHSGTTGEEKLMADFCFDYSGLNGPSYATIKPARSPQQMAVRYDMDPIPDCNGLGRRTIKLALQTKKQGDKEFQTGKPVFIRTHKGKENSKLLLDSPQACNKGTELKARLLAKVTYKNYDGKVKRRTHRFSKTSVSC